MKERGHILDVLNMVESSVENSDVVSLKALSNQTIHSASVEQDTDSVLMAVLVYSLSKIIERRGGLGNKVCDKFCEFVLKDLRESRVYLEKKDDKNFLKSLNKLRKDIENFSENYKKEVEDVLRKAQINKAAKIYEHGISLEKTAELLGITLFELAPYASQREENEEFIKTINVKNRIKKAEEFFG